MSASFVEVVASEVGSVLFFDVGFRSPVDEVRADENVIIFEAQGIFCSQVALWACLNLISACLDVLYLVSTRCLAPIAAILLRKVATAAAYPELWSKLLVRVATKSIVATCTAWGKPTATPIAYSTIAWSDSSAIATTSAR